MKGILAFFGLFLFAEISAEPAERKAYEFRQAQPQGKYAEILGRTELTAASGSSHHAGKGWKSQFTVNGVVSSQLFAVATDGVNLYVGGMFTTAGGTIANNIAKWDGAHWSSIGTGPENGVNGVVEGIAYTDGKLFVGGQFSKAGTRSVNGVAYWDGTEWKPLGTDSLNGVRDSAVYNGEVYIGRGSVYALGLHKQFVMVGGRFNLAGAVRTRGVAAWNAETGAWEEMNGGLEHPADPAQVYAFTFASSDSGVFIGGKFDAAGGVSAKHLARWNGKVWSDVGGGTNNWVMDADVDGSGHLYVGGYFSKAGDINARGVARWDGTQWHAFGAGVDPLDTSYTPTVRALRVIDGAVYIGGYFLQAGSAAVRSVAKWDGSQWTSLSTGAGNMGSPFPGTVNTMESIGSQLFVGGYHTAVDTIAVGGVARWDHSSSQWHALDDGSGGKGIQGGIIQTMEAGTGGLIVGGDFRVAGGTYAKRIARWNGTSWSSIGSGSENGINGSINDIVTDGDTIYIGGEFSLAGSTQAFHIAYWTGTMWKSMGIGVGGVSGARVNAMVKQGRYLYIGGMFSIVGDLEDMYRPAMSMARFHLDTERWESLGDGMELSNGAPGFVYDLEFHNGALYAAGSFQFAGKQPATNIALWQNGQWSPVPVSDGNALAGIATTLLSSPSGLIAGGRFTGIPGNVSLVTLSGTKWVPIAAPLTYRSNQGLVLDVKQQDGRLFLAGQFDKIEGVPASGFAMSDGDGWNDLGGGLDGVVYDVMPWNGSICLGGTFTSAGGAPSISFAQYEGALPTAVTAPAMTLRTLNLQQNYPNPFNPRTSIGYQLPAPGAASLIIYDAMGREVAVLVNEVQDAGSYAVSFDGSSVSSGIYFARLTSGGASQMRKLVLIK